MAAGYGPASKERGGAVKRILISNDDGIHAPGLKALVAILKPLAEVTVVAPLTEQSATSHALSLHHPVRIRELEPRLFAVEGTPTDCVLLAVNEFMPHKADLVVSGINHGQNLGEDVLYSGTVAAAMEGAILGIPSLAVSLASRKSADFEVAAGVTADLVENLLNTDHPASFLINVNIPPVRKEELSGVRVTRLGHRVYNNVVTKKQDPRGRDYYWIAGEPAWDPDEESDFAAVSAGYVSMTPLLMDLTDAPRFALLEELKDKLKT